MGKVLVLDDDIDILNVVEFIITEAGYDVLTLSSAENFLQKVREYQPDLVLLDITLPNHDGRILCTDLKAEKDFQHIPVIMFSAMHNEDVVMSGCKPDGFLAKPFDIDELIKTIKKYIRS